jgi:hypothetical protein
MEWGNINELCDIVRETSLLINFGSAKLQVKKYLQSLQE